MSSSDLAISVRGLSKAYTITHEREKHNTLAEAVLAGLRKPFAQGRSEAFWALKDVNLDVKKGDVVGIIGRNGAGKSTLLKIMSRITEPTSGQIELHGRVGSLLEVGTGFHQELTGRENIFLNGAILGMTKGEIRKQFDAIVDFAGVEKFLDTPVKRYSSGMYVRLAFAVAAHLETEILIVDEVLAVGDIEFQKKCFGKLGDVANAGRTVLFVSHNTAAIKQLCRTGALLRSGRIAYTGGIHRCVELYAARAGETGRRIIDHVSKRSAEATVDKLLVNRCDSDELHIAAESRNIAVEMTGTVHTPIRGSLQVRLYDSLGTRLGIFSPGFEKGGADLLLRGPFSLAHAFRLPRLNRGKYSLAFELVCPNVRAWFEALDGVSLYVEGAPMATGQTFDAHEQGSLLLDEVPADA